MVELVDDVKKVVILVMVMMRVMVRETMIRLCDSDENEVIIEADGDGEAG